jgi:hypothetical protein
MGVAQLRHFCQEQSQQRAFSLFLSLSLFISFFLSPIFSLKIQNNFDNCSATMDDKHLREGPLKTGLYAIFMIVGQFINWHLDQKSEKSSTDLAAFEDRDRITESQQDLQ